LAVAIAPVHFQVASFSASCAAQNRWRDFPVFPGLHIFRESRAWSLGRGHKAPCSGSRPTSPLTNPIQMSTRGRNGPPFLIPPLLSSPVLIGVNAHEGVRSEGFGDATPGPFRIPASRYRARGARQKEEKGSGEAKASLPPPPHFFRGQKKNRTDCVVRLPDDHIGSPFLLNNHRASFRPTI